MLHTAIRRFTIGFALVTALTTSPVISPAVAQQQISSINPQIQEVATAYMRQDTFPDATVLPEIVSTYESGDYAIAIWIWGEAGGEVILRKHGNQWTVIGGGGGAYSAAELQSNFGIPLQVAENLLQQIP